MSGPIKADRPKQPASPVPPAEKQPPVPKENASKELTTGVKREMLDPIKLQPAKPDLFVERPVGAYITSHAAFDNSRFISEHISTNPFASRESTFHSLLGNSKATQQVVLRQAVELLMRPGQTSLDKKQLGSLAGELKLLIPRDAEGFARDFPGVDFEKFQACIAELEK